MLAMSRGCSEQLPVEDASQMDIDTPDRQSASAASAGANVDSTAPRARSRPSAQGSLGQQRADRESGEPVLHEELPSAAMHFEGCLGDVLCVHLDFISILPQAVPLQQVTLVIAIMQVGAHQLHCCKYNQTAAQAAQCQLSEQLTGQR